jgi:hypothetical protein
MLSKWKVKILFTVEEILFTVEEILALSSNLLF